MDDILKETLALEAKEASKEPEKNDVASLPAQTNAQESPKEPEKDVVLKESLSVTSHRRHLVNLKEKTF